MDEEEENYPYIEDDDDEIEYPSRLSDTKYEVEAQVPKEQEENLSPYTPFFGRHVALGNTQRMDNIRHLDAYDSVSILDRCPTLRHLATELRGREISEFQMCRSNPEIGGFERKMRGSVIKRQDIKLQETKRPKKRGMFDFLKGKGD